jgi:hypothetical protein
LRAAEYHPTVVSLGSSEGISLKSPVRRTPLLPF